MKKNLPQPLKTVKEFLAPPPEQKTDNYRYRTGPILEPYPSERYQQMSQMDPRAALRREHDHPVLSLEEAAQKNNESIEIAKIDQSYVAMVQAAQSQNLMLKSQHKLLIATLITSLVALIVGIISLVDEPPVVNIQPPEVKVNVTPQ